MMIMEMFMSEKVYRAERKGIILEMTCQDSCVKIEVRDTDQRYPSMAQRLCYNVEESQERGHDLGDAIFHSAAQMMYEFFLRDNPEINRSSADGSQHH